MRSLSIICYHGSPGLPDDFLLLEKYLPGQHMIKVTRIGYGASNMAVFEMPKTSTVFLGYSWGAVDALRDAAKHIERAEGVILVSPYLFPRHRLSLAKKILLRTPIVSDLVLAVSGKRIIRQMLEETSNPNPVPSTYRRAAKQLSDPKVLRQAALEKDVSGRGLTASVVKLGAGNVPIAVIWGAKDRISKEAEQIDPIRRLISFKLEKQLPTAGHAIVWTHSKDLARFVASFLKQIGKEEKS